MAQALVGGRGPELLGPGREWSLGQLLGPDELAGDELAAEVSALTQLAFGHDADPTATRIEPVPYDFGSPATGALLRVHGASPSGDAWTLFCKVIQHVRHWKLIDVIPDFIRQEFLDSFPWRQELALWDEELSSTMPDGLRAPALHALVDLGDDQWALWLEHVEESTEPWTLERYAAAAHLLGRWNMRATDPEVVASCPEPRGFAMRMYGEKTVPFRGLVPLADDELWSHPWLADHADLRAALLALGPRVSSLLDAQDELQQCRPHGDASPQNLLIPADQPETFVAIDISYQSPGALGADLSQLAVGLVHADVVPADQLPVIADTILAAYVEGLRAEGWDGDVADIERGFLTSALVRSGFDGFRYDLLDGDPGDAGARRTFDQRIGLARFIADRAGRLL